MGAWGCESCSNDSCWDHLDGEDIHEMTQKEGTSSVTKVFQKLNGRSAKDKETKLGVVIWILRQGLQVEKEYLIKARKFAEDLIKDKGYLECWDNDRKPQLDKEIKEIDVVLKNDGIGTKQHIPGLFEKMAKDMLE